MTVDQFLQAIGYGAAIIGGGVGAEAIRWWRERGQSQVDLQTTIRKELRDDNQTLRTEQEKQQD
jgi:hypothetical protein